MGAICQSPDSVLGAGVAWCPYSPKNHFLLVSQHGEQEVKCAEQAGVCAAEGAPVNLLAESRPDVCKIVLNKGTVQVCSISAVMLFRPGWHVLCHGVRLRKFSDQGQDFTKSFSARSLIFGQMAAFPVASKHSAVSRGRVSLFSPFI